MLTTEIIADEMRFDTLASVWDELAARDVNATIFQQYAWNRAWWRQFRGHKGLAITLVRDGAEVVGIAPLMSVGSATGMRAVRFIGSGPADYGDIVALPDRREEVCRELARMLLTELGFAVDLQQLREDSPHTALLKSELEHQGGRPRLIEQEEAFYLDLPSSWAEYLGHLGSKTRYNVKYFRRRLARDYQYEVRDAGDGPAEAMPLLFRLHQQRWQEKLLPGTFAFPRVRRFHQEVAELLAQQRKLVLSVLRLDGEPAAAFYGFRHCGTDYFYLCGFDTRRARLSVGAVLVGEMIESAITAGSTRFDFLRGDEPYKQRWRAVARRNYRLLAAPVSLRSRVYLALREKENTIVLRAKSQLRSGWPRSGQKSRV